MAVAFYELNLNEEKQGQFTIVYDSLRKVQVNGRKLASSSLLTAARVQGCYSRSDTSESFCKLNGKQIEEEYGVCHTTAVNAIKTLIEGNIIKREKRTYAGSSFSFTPIINSGTYDVIPLYLHTMKVKGKDGWAKLRPSCVSVCARLLRLCMPQEVRKELQDPKVSIQKKYKFLKNTKFTCTTSVRELSDGLNLSTRIVYEALNELKDDYIILWSEKNKGKNGSRRSVFEIQATDLYEYLLNRKPKKEKAVTTPVTEAVASVDARAERDSFYAKRKQKAEDDSEAWQKKAKQNPQYKAVAARLSQLEIDLSKAELFNPKKLPALQREKEELNSERARLLSSMGIKELWLQPQYYCKKCNDSGWQISGGAPCDCYRPRREYL